MLEQPQVIDFSNVSLPPADLQRLENMPGAYHRYNKAQTQEIARLFYVPHQVEQYNGFVIGQHSARCPPLSRDKTPVKLEEVMPVALEHVGKLFDAYSAIPKGAYYAWEEEGQFSFVSAKKFDGFVTRELKFWFCPLSESDLEMPDPHVFVPWGYEDYLINMGVDSTFRSSFKIHTEAEARELLSREYARHQKVWASQQATKLREMVKLNKEKGVEVWDSSFSSWDDFLKARLAKIGNSVFKVYRARSKCRELGFEPNTDEVKTLDELTGFVFRFLNSQEQGGPFKE